MGAVVEHGGNLAVDVAEGAVFDDDDDCSGRGEVLLGAGVDEVILADIDGTREDVTRHIGYQRHFHVGILADFRTVDGVVGGVVEIVDIVRHGIFGNICVVVGFRRTNNFDFAEEFGFFDGFVGPCAGVEICCLGFQQVEGGHAELEACAAAEEEHAVAFGHVQQLFDQSLSLVHNGNKFFAAVAHFEK